MAKLFATKPLNVLMSEAQEAGVHSLKRTLGPVNLIALGIGAIIGAGLFVRTAAAIADRAGPSVVLAFMVAGIGCAFAGLCYAEFASMIPVAGSAYTYSYATMGELVAWIIGWDLVLEYALGAATVAIAWSEYANRVLDWFGWRIPYAWSHSPFETAANGAHGMMNTPAVFILLLLTGLLIRGTRESAFVNGFIVVLKLSIVLLVIGIGWGFINPANHTPLIPPATTYTTPQGIVHHYGGIMGILGAAGVIFFAYIGFDAVSTAAQEAKNPKRDMPIGIIGSLLICTLLYISFSWVLTGIVRAVTRVGGAGIPVIRTWRTRRRLVVGRARRRGPGAVLRRVALASRRPADDRRRLEGIGRARRARSVARLVHVARPRRGAADRPGVPRRVLTRSIRPVASVGRADVAVVRARGAGRRLVVRRTRGARPGAVLRRVALPARRPADDG